jgi:hypothetical protein
MNLAQLIHARWAAAPQLNDLLSVAKVMTGTFFATDPGARYATVTLPGSRAHGFLNDGSSLEVVTIRLRIHHDDYDLGKAVVDAALAVFDRSEFALSADERVINMQRTGLPQELQDPRTGQWDWVIEFHCRVHRGVGQ